MLFVRSLEPLKTALICIQNRKREPLTTVGLTTADLTRARIRVMVRIRVRIIVRVIVRVRVRFIKVKAWVRVSRNHIRRSQPKP